MSRNLRAGAQKGFDFAFSDDDEDSPSPSPQKGLSPATDDQGEAESDQEGHQKQAYSQKGGFNLLLHNSQ